MTETDISKVLIEGEYSTIMGVKYKRVEEPKSPVAKAYKEWWGQYPELETDSEYDDMRWQGFQAGFQAAYQEQVREDEYYDKVVDKMVKEPKPRSPLDEIVDEMVKDQPSFERVAKSLFDLIGDSDFCTFNGNRFDIPMLMEEFARVGYELDMTNRNCIDVKRIFHRKISNP